MAGKVFMACALGGGVGALVALQMWQPFWWVGMLVGALVGYLAYEFDEVRRAVSLAWRKTIGWRPKWRPRREWWRVFLRLLPNSVLGFPSVFSVPFFSLFAWTFDAREVAGNILTFGFLVLFFVMLGVNINISTTARVLEGEMNVSKAVKEAWEINVFRVYFWVGPRAIGKGVWLAVTRGPGWVARGVVVIARFLWQVFCLVHSEMRLLCGLDAAIGAAVGYWLGNASIGALAGGIFGLANFEIVSRRWLKLVPMKAK